MEALRGVSVEFAAGEYTAIMGASGSGKSTLLHCMAGLDKPTSGTVWIGDQDLTHLKDRRSRSSAATASGSSSRRSTWSRRCRRPRTSPCPRDIAGRTVDRERFDEVIDTIGLRDRLTHLPSELSGGQQQRVAAARALVSRPEIVFADEPTGNLDSRASQELLTFLKAAVTDRGQTIVMVTHDPVGASYADRIVFLADGQIVDEMRDPTAERVLDRMKSLET